MYVITDSWFPNWFQLEYKFAPLVVHSVRVEEDAELLREYLLIVATLLVVHQLASLLMQLFYEQFQQWQHAAQIKVFLVL